MLTPTQCIQLIDYKDTSNICNLKKVVISGHVLHRDFVESLWKMFPGRNKWYTERQNLNSIFLRGIIQVCLFLKLTA